MTDRILAPSDAPAREVRTGPRAAFPRGWIAGCVAITMVFAWPFVRHFPDAQVSVLARNVADSCLLEHVLERVSTTGEWFLDWKLTQAPYVFPDYPLVAALASMTGYGFASAAYPLLFCILASVGWGIYLARAGVAPAAIAFLIVSIFGMLWLDNAPGSAAETYAYLFLPGHHTAFTLLAPAIFGSLAVALGPGSGWMFWCCLGGYAVLSGLAAMGDPLSLFMFVGPAAVLAVWFAATRRIPWRRAGVLLAACGVAFLIGQAYQLVALYPTGRHYTRELLGPLLSGPGTAVAAAMKTSVPVFLRDVREYYLNPARTGIWFLLPLAGWALAVRVLGRCVVRPHPAGTSADEPDGERLVIVPAMSLLLGLPATVLLQVLLVGYQGSALSRQFVAFLFLGIVVFSIVAGRALERLRDRGPALRTRIDLAAAVVLAAITIGFWLRATPEAITRRTPWHAIAERADAIHGLAREAGVKRVMVSYWLAPPLSLRHPDLDVDLYITDMIYLEPRVRDPAVYRDGPIEAYAVEPLSLPETRLVELFGPPERILSRETPSGETVKLLLFPGEKPRTYNQWVTSYSPAIHGTRATFPASTLAHLQPPQHGGSNYRFTPDASTAAVRPVHTFISLWPGASRFILRFSGPLKPKRAVVTLLHRGNKILDAVEASVDATTGEAAIDVVPPRNVDPQVLGELIVDVPVDPRPAEGEAYVFEGLTIERKERW